MKIFGGPDAGAEEIVIAKNSSAFEGAYGKEDFHKNPQKYLEIKSLLYLKDDFFYDTSIEIEGSFKHISLTNLRNRPFEINFDKPSSEPKIPEGLNYDKETVKKYENSFRTMKAQTFYSPYDEKLLKDNIATLKIDTSSDEYTLRLYKKYGSLTGYFLETSHHDDKIFELSAEDAPLFFYNVQDFWEKRISLENQGGEFEIAFSDEKSYRVQVQPGKAFKVKNVSVSSDEEAIHTAFKKLLDFIHTREAKMVSRVYKENPSDQRWFMELEFPDKILRFNHSDGELVIYNVTYGFRLHYLVGDDLPFAKKVKDYFR